MMAEQQSKSARSARFRNQSDNYGERVADFYSPNSKISDRPPDESKRQNDFGDLDSTRSDSKDAIYNQTPLGVRTIHVSGVDASSASVSNRKDVSTSRFHMNSGMMQSVYAASAAGLASIFCETVSHPLVLFRHQCQVSISPRYHLAPFGVFTVGSRLVRNQGVQCLTKGIGTIFILRSGFTLLDTTLAELLDCPRELTQCSSTKQYVQFFVLKLVSGAVMLPFYAVHVTDCVRSDLLGDRSSIADFFHDACDRAVNIVTFGARPSSLRSSPLWSLVLPASVFFASHFAIRSIVKHFMRVKLTQRAESRARANSPDHDSDALPFIPESPLIINSGNSTASAQRVEHKSTFHTNRPKQIQVNEYERIYVDLVATVVGALIADAQLYAFETVLNRLCVQGTRTLIDDVATGVNVVPVTFHYTGVFDAVRCILREEGVTGFYRGFGALTLQYALQLAVIRLGLLAVDRINDLYTARRNPRSVATPLRQGVKKYKLPPRRSDDD